MPLMLAPPAVRAPVHAGRGTPEALRLSSYAEAVTTTAVDGLGANLVDAARRIRAGALARLRRTEG